MGDGAGPEAWDAALHRPEGLVRGTSPGGFATRLQQWLRDAQVDEAARQRTREHWLRDVAEQEATLAGVLADLAERRGPVVVRTGAGRRHHGTITALGVDFVTLATASGSEVLLASRALGVIRTAPAMTVTMGDRMVSTELRLTDVLAELAAERERVVIVTVAGDDAVTGRLRSVGHDVVALRTETDPPATAYVPVAVIGEVTLV